MTTGNWQVADGLLSWLYLCLYLFLYLYCIRIPISDLTSGPSLDVITGACVQRTWAARWLTVFSAGCLYDTGCICICIFVFVFYVITG